MKLRLSQTLKKNSSPELSEQENPLAEAIVLCVVALVFLLFGLAMLYSTSYGIRGSSSYYFLRQFQWSIVGLAGFSAVICIGYKKLSDWSWLMMIIIAGFLVMALMFPAIKGARRWIIIPGIGSIQPSEYAKVIIALFISKLSADNLKMIKEQPFRFLVLAGISTVYVIGLVFAGKDLGTTLLLSTIVLAVIYAAGEKLLYILVIPITGAVSIFYLIKFFSPFRWTRLVTYLDPEKYQAGSGYQLWLSMLALGSGGWTGVGLGESRMKQKYLPEAHTDFILSIVGEELGYIWMCIVILAYALFIWLAIQISRRARTRQGMLLVFGLSTYLALQAFINIGVISGFLPTKGMPAPFISYGGSSLVASLTAVGLIVSVALDTAYPDYPAILKAKIMQFLHHLPFCSKQGSSEK